MKDFKKAHSNMVFGQLLPNKLVDPRLLHALTEVWREGFVPESTQPLSYCDQSIGLDQGRKSLSSLALMRLLQKAFVTKTDRILDVASGTGYGAVILSYLGKSVVCVEENDTLYKALLANLDQADVRSVKAVKGALPKGAQKQGPYDLIIIEGAVQDMPFSLLDQLAPGGRLLAYEPLFSDDVREMSRAVCYQCSGSGSKKSYTKTYLFEACAPRLGGFNVPQKFRL